MQIWSDVESDGIVMKRPTFFFNLRSVEVLALLVYPPLVGYFFSMLITATVSNVQACHSNYKEQGEQHQDTFKAFSFRLIIHSAVPDRVFSPSMIGTSDQYFSLFTRQLRLPTCVIAVQTKIAQKAIIHLAMTRLKPAEI
jgi:hypothetical protein